MCVGGDYTQLLLPAGEERSTIAILTSLTTRVRIVLLLDTLLELLLLIIIIKKKLPAGEERSTIACAMLLCLELRPPPEAILRSAWLTLKPATPLPWFTPPEEMALNVAPLPRDGAMAALEWGREIHK